jgi:hypothetical protein
MRNLPQNQKQLKERLSVKIHPDLMDVLAAAASRRGVDPAKIVEEALDAMLVQAPRLDAIEAGYTQHLAQVILVDQKLDALAEFIARATR